MSDRIRVEGLREAVRALDRAGVDAQDMKDVMFAIGMLVVNATMPPRDSGTLAGTLRAGRGKTKAVVRAGGARAPYAGVIHYGWPGHGIRPQPFLSDALQRKRSDIFRSLDQGVSQILKANDL
ncbi:hypothetical protein [Microbacterium murale]|uniref:HK97 gp10 family phage protein n=1 Tax=Microbacterium murale TaxID=1081040 RepID=A0ABU0PEA5_9MICO|nr:hypothetical protein [Microbacterium murale]MDQ0645665.1 hypothetical protein [Microbacterium murale]